MMSLPRFLLPAVLATLGLVALWWKSTEITAYSENLRRLSIDIPIPFLEDAAGADPIFLPHSLDESSSNGGFFMGEPHGFNVHRPFRTVALSSAEESHAAAAAAPVVASEAGDASSGRADLYPIVKGPIGTTPANPSPAAPSTASLQSIAVQGPEFCGTPATDVSNHGGNIMASGVNLYTLWISNSGGDYPISTNPAATVNVLTDFTKSLGGSKYLNMITGYKNTAGVAAKNVMTLKTTKKYVVPPSVKSLNDSYIRSLISYSINTQGVPVDSNGIYIVYFKGSLPYSSTMLGGSYGSTWCGYHSAMNFVKNGVKTVLKFILVGDPNFSPAGTTFDNSPLNACAAQLTNTPNANVGADAMTNVLAHELFESMTDPEFNGYFNTYKCETGDLCAWTFNDPATPLTTNYNVQLGTRKYLLQQIWTYKSATQSTSKCALCYNGQC